ncbi:MAG: dATP/dGTP diphosphohydrolase domain-containing protein [Dehalococcoidia bacterium]
MGHTDAPLTPRATEVEFHDNPVNPAQKDATLIVGSVVPAPGHPSPHARRDTTEEWDMRPKAEKAVEHKDTNPKDAVGTKKWRQYCTVPTTVIWELGVAMLEGARKYGRHNYRVAGVRASVYIDAAKGHIDQWWEGEDIDEESKLNHIIKAIASLAVLRDAMIQNRWLDDRPPKTDLPKLRADLQGAVDGIFERIPEAKDAYLEGDQHDGD